MTYVCGSLSMPVFLQQLVAAATGAVRHVQVVDPVAAAQPAARSKDLMRAMKEAAQGIGMRGGREVSSSRPHSRAWQQAASGDAALGGG
jgi:hypothetical protein